MAVPHQAQIRDPTYINWVRAGLALKYTKEGMEAFIDHETKDFHISLLKKLGHLPTGPQTCGHCTKDNLLPHQSLACPVRKENCICSRGPINQRQSCPNNTCGTLFNEILSAHRFMGPSWKNSNMSQWVADHWEVAKNFLPNTGGYLNITSASDTDLSGLVNIGINLRNISQRHTFTVSSVNGPDAFIKCRTTRNEILHNARQCLTDVELIDYLCVMKDTLQCTAALKNDVAAQQAVTKLIQLETSAFEITDEDITKVRQMVESAIQDEGSKQVGTIKDEGEKQEQSVRQAEKRALGSINLECDRQRKLMKTEGEEASRVIQNKGNQQVEALKVEGKNQMQSIQQAVTTLADARYQEEKNKLKRHLIDTYVAQLQPDTLPEVDRLYVQPRIELVTDGSGDSKDSRVSKKMTDSNVTITDVFSHEQTKFTRIYISGDAGHGKTALCKMLVLAWCQEHSNDVINEHIPDDFLAVMRNFGLLFYITLRNMREVWSISQMIKTQYFENQNFLDMFIKNECDKRSCLVILDGLDEWDIPAGYDTPMHTTYGLPDLRHLEKYTVLTTTRPWKLEVVRPKQHEMDRQVRLTGIGRRACNKYISQIVDILNMKENVLKDIYCFQAQLFKKELTHLQNIPILLKQLITLWFHDENEITGSSHVHLYSAMVNHLLKDAWERNKKTSLSGGNTHQSELPQCLKQKQYCKIHKDLLSSLAHLAFNSAIEGHLIFDHVEASHQDVSEDDIKSCLTAGLLCQEIYASPQDNEKKKLSFLHKSFQDFLAAVFLVMNPKSLLPKTCNTMHKILDMRAVFIFVSGMDYQVISPLSQQMQTILENDEGVKQHNTELDLEQLEPVQDLMCKCVKESNDTVKKLPLCHLESVVIRDGLESDADISSLEHLISINKSCIKYVHIENIGSLCKDLLTCLNLLSECRPGHVGIRLYKKLPHDLDTLLDKAICNWSLLSLKLEGSECAPCCRYLHSDRVSILTNLIICNVQISSCTLYHSLVEDVGHATQLNRLRLCNIACGECKLRKHSCHLDMSNCLQLHKLTLEDCIVTKVTINTTSLTNCKVCDTPVYFVPHSHMRTTLQTLVLKKITDQHALDEIFTILPHLNQLTLLELQYVDDGEEEFSRHLDLSNCSQLQTLVLEECNVTNVTINTSLTDCNVSGTPVYFVPHPHVKSSIHTLVLEEIKDPRFLYEIVNILPNLSQLSQLMLQDIAGGEETCSHHLDLSKCSQLHTLILENCNVSKVTINITSLRYCNASGTPVFFVPHIHAGSSICTLELKKITDSQSLDEIFTFLPHLNNLTLLDLQYLTGEEEKCFPNLDLSNCSELQKLTLQDSIVAKVTINIASLKYCKVSGTSVYFVQSPHVGTTIQTLELRKITDPHSLLEIATILPQLTGLSRLELEDIAGEKEKCSNHLDLSNCSKLQTIILDKCMITKVTINTTVLKDCQVSGTPVNFVPRPHVGTTIQRLELKKISGLQSLLEIVTILPHLTGLTRLKLEDIAGGEEKCSQQLDLSNCSQLHTLFLEDCNVTKVTISITSLKYCITSGSPVFFVPRPYAGTAIQGVELKKIRDQHSLDEIVTFLPHLIQLSHLVLQNIAGGEEEFTHHLDLSNNSKILKLILEDCNIKKVTINTRSLKKCIVSGSPVYFVPRPHVWPYILKVELKKITDQQSLDEIFTILPHLTQLSLLVLQNLAGGEEDFSHYLDLSSSSQLRKLTLEDCNVKKVTINTRSLKHCHVSGTSVYFVPHPHVKTDINTLALKMITDPHSLDEIVRFLPHCAKLSFLRLEDLDFGDKDTFLSTEATNLQSVKLHNVTLTDDAMIQFLDSILTTNSAVDCEICGKINEIVKTHITARFVVQAYSPGRYHVLHFRSRPAAP